MICDKAILRFAGRVAMRSTALEGFGKTLDESDEVMSEATGNKMAVARGMIANPSQVQAITHT